MSVGATAQARPELSPEVLEAIRPVSLSKEQLLPVSEPLKPLFPWGGIQRGWSVGVAGPGAWLVASSLLGSALGAEEWVAIVGAEHLNLVTAAHSGLRLDRVLLVESPSSGQLGTVVSALMEAVQAVVIAPNSTVGARDARRLGAKLREQRGTLWHLDGGQNWPTGVDLTINVATTGWNGLGLGHGHLKERFLRVTADGRRSASRPTSVNLLLTESGLEPVPDVAKVTQLFPPGAVRITETQQ